MEHPSCKKQHIILYCVMTHMLIHAQDQDLAVFLKERFDFNNKWLGSLQQLLGDTLSLFGQEIRMSLQG